MTTAGQPFPVHAGGSPAAPAPPGPVRHAWLLWTAMVATWLAADVLSIFQVRAADPALDAQIRDQFRALNEQFGARDTRFPPVDAAIVEQLTATNTLPMYVSIALFATGTVVSLVFARLMRAGHNWARVLITVVGLLLCPLGLVVVRAEGVPLTALDVAYLSVRGVGIGLLACAVVLMFRPGANRYFRHCAVWRALRRLQPG